jgi:RNA polymerase sigma-70 factor (ECF subfamily)
MAGDGEAVRSLWEEHRRWVAAVILAHKPAFEDLEDLLQEVAMTLIAKIDTLREETNLRAWLRTVAVNAARAAGRSGRYRPRTELPDDLGAAGESIDDHAERDRVRRMLARIDQLPDTYREPLMLRAVKGLRSKQIADLLGVQPATVDTRIARARRMLREIEDETTDGGDERSGRRRPEMGLETRARTGGPLFRSERG